MAKRLSSIIPSILTSDRRKSSVQDAPYTSPADDGRGRTQHPRHLPPQPPSQSHQRATSANYLATPNDLPQLSLPPFAHERHASSGSLSSLQPPPPIVARRSRSPSGDRSSVISSPALTTSSRPGTSRLGTPEPRSPSDNMHSSPEVAIEGSAEKKGHHLSKTHVKKGDKEGPYAWIAGTKQRVPYDVDSLINGKPMPELCDDVEGDCFVFFWPNGSGIGASFRIDSAVFAASPILNNLVIGDESAPDSHRRNRQLFLPLKFKSPEPPTTTKDALSAEARVDIQTLVDFRNFFGFLCGSSLIATESKPTLFSILSTIAGILESYEFSNMDGSTFGEVASSSFDGYVAELGLADVRGSREKTIEALILAERMKSVFLYNEAFTHAAGKYNDLLALKSPKWSLVSVSTQTRLTRASMDLDKRVVAIEGILKDFDFPALFSGIMNSKVSEERKEGVVFGGWKDAFNATRKFVIGSYSRRYGNWPPKAKSKKNDLETGGLNRRVLRDVYSDMSGMYDLLVDRNSLTTRTANGIDLAGDKEDPMIRALRSVLSEYDRSYPPVKPPVPFDLPKLPDLRSTRREATGDPMKDAKMFTKKLKEDDIAKVLTASHNRDAKITPFVEAFQEMEKRAARGCTIGELIDRRIGQWIFMYVVLQALPLLACDAPCVKHTSGVEYFLCEPPRRGVPWANATAGSLGRTSGLDRQWFSVGDGSGVVELPSDLVEHGIDGIYRRSHCWIMAEQWSAANPILNEALHEQERTTAPPADNLPHRPPTANSHLAPNSRSGSPARSHKRMSTIGIGLEALTVPPTLGPDGRAVTPDRASFVGSRSSSRAPIHNVDTTKTFDAILGSTDKASSEKDKKIRKK